MYASQKKKKERKKKRKKERKNKRKKIYLQNLSNISLMKFLLEWILNDYFLKYTLAMEDDIKQ